MKTTVTKEEFEKSLSRIAQRSFEQFKLEENIKKNFKFKIKNGVLAQILNGLNYNK